MTDRLDKEDDDYYEEIRDYYVTRRGDRPIRIAKLLHRFPDADEAEIKRRIRINNWEGQRVHYNEITEQTKRSMYEDFAKDRGVTEATATINAIRALDAQAQYMIPAVVEAIMERLTQDPDEVSLAELVSILRTLNTATDKAAKLSQTERMAHHRIGIDKLKLASKEAEEEEEDDTQALLYETLGLTPAMVSKVVELLSKQKGGTDIKALIGAELATLPSSADFDYHDAEFKDLTDNGRSEKQDEDEDE